MGRRSASRAQPGGMRSFSRCARRIFPRATIEVDMSSTTGVLAAARGGHRERVGAEEGFGPAPGGHGGGAVARAEADQPLARRPSGCSRRAGRCGWCCGSATGRRRTGGPCRSRSACPAAAAVCPSPLPPSRWVTASASLRTFTSVGTTTRPRSIRSASGQEIDPVGRDAAPLGHDEVVRRRPRLGVIRAQRPQHGDADRRQVVRGDPHPSSSTMPSERKTGSSLLSSTLLIPPARAAAFCFSFSTRLREAASTFSISFGERSPSRRRRPAPGRRDSRSPRRTGSGG